MEVEFLFNDPHQKARPRLDDVLSKGVDQLAVACAFCTRAGVEILSKHARRLGQPDSFVVVSSTKPTDYKALESLWHLIPDNLFIHWGGQAPQEVRAWGPLMHSKIFYARRGSGCWLWTGSHNLTASATQGVNCEAAVLIHGDAEEPPFVAALAHLQACRAAATPYDPDTPPLGGVVRADILSVHAECDRIPEIPLPWDIHLCLKTSEFDELLTAPAELRLFLYPLGSLANGWQDRTPIAAFAGTLTGQNLTSQNPTIRSGGTPAVWSAARFSITEQGNVLVLGEARPLDPAVTTQAVLHVDGHSSVDESLFEAQPKVVNELIPGPMKLMPVDYDMRIFFKRQHVAGPMLREIPFVGRRRVIKGKEGDARPEDYDKMAEQLDRADANIPLVRDPMTDAERSKRHPFIVRAKYRLPD